MKLSEQISLTNPNQQTIGILGQKGTGKTITTKLLCYEWTESKIPCLIFDSLNVFPKNKIIDRLLVNPSMKKNAQELIKIGREYARLHKSLIISYQNCINSEIIEFTDMFLSNISIKDYMVVFDEIQEFSPQQGESSEEVIRFIRTCRNRNNGVLFNTQRAASVSKNIIALIDILIIFRTVWINDIKVLDSVIYRMMSDQNDAKMICSMIPKLNKMNGISIRA